VYLKQHGRQSGGVVGIDSLLYVLQRGARLHQSLGYKTPDIVYRTAEGGGAKIVDEFNEATEASALV
jgi:putative transposase